MIFEDNNGNHYEFTIISNNIQDNSLTKSFILANIIGEDPDGDGRVEDSSLKLDKITFDSYQCSHPVIFKNIHVYRIKNVETFDNHDNTEYAPYVSNSLIPDFSPFYLDRSDDYIHNPYTSDDTLVDFLKNYNDYLKTYDDYDYYWPPEDLSWFLQERDGLRPLFISNTNQPWKLNNDQVFDVARTIGYTISPETRDPILPNYLSPAATTLELSFSISDLDTDVRDGEVLIELNFVDALRQKLQDIYSKYYLWDLPAEYYYILETVSEDYNIKLKGQFFKITEEDGPDAKIIWSVEDNWSPNITGDAEYSTLPFDTSYIYYDTEYKITVDYGRPYYGDPSDELGDYRHNVAYSLLYDFANPNDFYDEDACGEFRGFTVSFDDDILLGGIKEEKNASGLVM
ncbi:hypothetical protein ES708_24304 [subsurface metagenome]